MGTWIDGVMTTARQSVKLDRDGGEPDSILDHALQFFPDVFMGGAEAVWDMAKGIGTLILHPIATAKGFYTLASKLVTEPGPTLRAIGSALVDPYVDAVNAGHIGKAVGRGIVEIGSLFISPADIVNVARGGRAFAGALTSGVKAGQALPLTLRNAGNASKYTMYATAAARDAEILALLGKATEASTMAQYAAHALDVAKLAATTDAVGLRTALQAVKMTSKVSVGGHLVELATFMADAKKILGLKRFGLVGARVSGNAFRFGSDAKLAAAATRVAEEVLANGSKTPSILNRIGRFAVRNPQILAPLTPALGKLPDVLGKIDAVPTDLPDGEGLTPASAKEIAFKYNLDPAVENVRAFITEVSSYAGNTIGPDTSNSEQVRELQGLLRTAQYDVTVTGVWDRATANAVIELKKKHQFHQAYRLASGLHAYNEYADEHVINALLNKLD